MLGLHLYYAKAVRRIISWLGLKHVMICYCYRATVVQEYSKFWENVISDYAAIWTVNESPDYNEGIEIERNETINEVQIFI